MPAARLDTLEDDEHAKSLTPLVMIHDGGGTIFQYFLLGPFFRPVFGIGNPYFDTGRKPDGGLTELAGEYARAIKTQFSNRKIILGGWSFGGLLSVEVARQLGQDSDVTVIGMIMIDSPCPWSTICKMRGRVRPNYRKNTSDAIKEKVNSSFDNAREMILEWERPPPFAAPPAIMIRASDAMGIKNSPDGVQQAKDSDGRLGWSEYPSVEFLSVITVPGDHFSMFADDRLESMTRIIKESCATIDQHRT